MEETSLVKEEIRKIQVIRVLALMTNQGMSKPKACEIAGISVSTFDRWKDTKDDTAAEFLAEVQGPLLNLYEDIVKSQTRLIQLLLVEASDPELSVKDALAIEKRLEEKRLFLQEQLALVGHTAPTITPDPAGERSLTAAENFVATLKAPALKHGKNITGVKVIETVETTTTIQLSEDQPNLTDDFIEGETKP